LLNNLEMKYINIQMVDLKGTLPVHTDYNEEILRYISHEVINFLKT